MKVKDLVKVSDFRVDVLEITELYDLEDNNWFYKPIWSSWLALHKLGGTVRKFVPTKFLDRNVALFDVYVHDDDLVMNIVLEKD